MTLLGINREFKPIKPDADQGLNAETAGHYLTAKEIAKAASLPLHLFHDRAQRSRKYVPHLMLVGNLRFSLPAILQWEMANSVKGGVAAAAGEAAASPEKPSEPAKRWYEIVSEQEVWPPGRTCRDLAGLEMLMGFGLQTPCLQPVRA
jgi:hypothetical protein